MPGVALGSKGEERSGLALAGFVDETSDLLSAPSRGEVGDGLLKNVRTLHRWV